MKAYLIVAYLFLTAPAIGQKHSISLNYMPSLTYFGKQTQSFKHYYFASRKGNQTFNSSVNVLYSYKLSSKVSLTTGLEYSQQGQNINFNADSAFPSDNRKILKIELNYLRIPVTINYSILKMAKSELNIYSGISLGIVNKRRDNYQDIILDFVLLGPAEKRYKSEDWALPIGANYKKELTSGVFANLGFEYLFGLTNAFSDSSAEVGVLSEFYNSKQNRLSLNIGISFNLTK